MIVPHLCYKNCALLFKDIVFAKYTHTHTYIHTAEVFDLLYKIFCLDWSEMEGREGSHIWERYFISRYFSNDVFSFFSC